MSPRPSLAFLVGHHVRHSLGDGGSSGSVERRLMVALRVE
jgi:hypothetical protein